MSTSAHVRWVAAAWAVCAVGGWSAEALVGWDQAGLVLMVLAALAWRRTWHPRAVLLTREATAEALRAHRDPGEDLRAPTTEHARESLARSPWAGRGLALALLGLAVACGLAGVRRDDGWDAAPALPLLVVAAGAVAVDRLSRQRARRWVEDPPYAAPVDLPG